MYLSCFDSAAEFVCFAAVCCDERMKYYSPFSFVQLVAFITHAKLGLSANQGLFRVSSELALQTNASTLGRGSSSVY